MTYEKFIESYLNEGLLKKQKTSHSAVEKHILRSHKDLRSAKANLSIDEGVAYTVAYLAMLRAGRAFLLLRGFRPTDGYQHKTVVEFMSHALGEEYKSVVEHFDRIRKKRNIFTYEIDIFISKKEAGTVFETAVQFVELVKNLIRKENPQAHFKF